MPVWRRPSRAPRSRREAVTDHLVAREPVAPVPVLLRRGWSNPRCPARGCCRCPRGRGCRPDPDASRSPIDVDEHPCSDAARREGFEPPTARSVAWCSASIWSAPDGSGLLTLDGSSIWSDLDRSRRIVWMIKRMIKQVRQFQRAQSTSDRLPREASPGLVVTLGSTLQQCR
jgi:hypothetical protein